MISRSCNRNAFATFTALVLLGIVGIALESLALFGTGEFRRTRSTVDESQIESLLIAGSRIAQSAISSRQTTIEIPVPGDLNNALLRIMRTSATGSEAEFQIIAGMGNRSASEHIHFVRDQASWIIDRASLDN